MPSRGVTRCRFSARSPLSFVRPTSPSSSSFYCDFLFGLSLPWFCSSAFAYVGFFRSLPWTLFVTRDLFTSAFVPVCFILFPSIQYCVLPALLRYFLLSTCIVVLLYCITLLHLFRYILLPHHILHVFFGRLKKKMLHPHIP